MIVLQFLAGIACVIVVLGLLAWWASKDASAIPSPRLDAEKLLAEREQADRDVDTVRDALAPWRDEGAF